MLSNSLYANPLCSPQHNRAILHSARKTNLPYGLAVRIADTIPSTPGDTLIVILDGLGYLMINMETEQNSSSKYHRLEAYLQCYYKTIQKATQDGTRLQWMGKGLRCGGGL